MAYKLILKNPQLLHVTIVSNKDMSQMYMYSVG